MSNEGSPQFSLAKSDWLKITKGAGIAALAAVLTYAAEVLIPNLEHRPGANAAMFALLAKLINAARKFVTSTLTTVPFWIGCVLLCSTCEGQTSDPGYASYRIWCGNGAGSCTGVAPNLVVTNVHVAGTGGAKCRIAHPLTNREWQGQTVAGDREADVALVRIATDDLDWVELGENPFAGKVCHHYGYGGGRGMLKMGSGQYTQNLGRSWYAATQSVSGDSGGGLFDDQGRLTSVNWGSTSGGTSVSTPVSYVVSLLARYRNEPQQPNQPHRPIATRPGRPAPKQPVQLGPKTLVDPLKEFDVDRLIATMEQRK